MKSLVLAAIGVSLCCAAPSNASLPVEPLGRASSTNPEPLDRQKAMDCRAAALQIIDYALIHMVGWRAKKGTLTLTTHGYDPVCRSYGEVDWSGFAKTLGRDGKWRRITRTVHLKNLTGLRSYTRRIRLFRTVSNAPPPDFRGPSAVTWIPVASLHMAVAHRVDRSGVG